MKKTFLNVLIFAFPTFLLAQNAAITGKVANTSANSVIYLYEYFGSDFYKVDSAFVKSGIFKIAPAKPLPRGFYQLGFDKTNSAILIVANEQISVECDAKDVRTSLKVSNSKENTFFKELITSNTELAKIDGERKELASLKDSNPIEYTIKSGALQRRYDSLMASSNAMKANLVQNHSGLFFSKVLSMFMINDKTEKDDFFRLDELKDDEYTRGDMMINKVNYYLQKFGGQDEKLWLAEATDLAKRSQEKSRVRELIYISAIQVIAQSGMQLPSSLIKSLKAEYGGSKRTKEFLNLLPKGEPNEGDEAPDIVLEDATGKKIALSSLKGKIVLIDFWASWCGPCRMENPNVVRVYNAYKDKGFTIYSVSLDNSKDNWLAAIQKDGLTWTSHVSDLKGWASAGAALYSVKGIPATFLVDKNGIIIGKNLRGIALEKKLSELIP